MEKQITRTALNSWCETSILQAHWMKHRTFFFLQEEEEEEEDT